MRKRHRRSRYPRYWLTPLTAAIALFSLIGFSHVRQVFVSRVIVFGDGEDGFELEDWCLSVERGRVRYLWSRLDTRELRTALRLGTARLLDPNLAIGGLPPWSDLFSLTLPAGALAMLATGQIGYAMLRARREREHCVCGYDCTGLADRCPECGADR